MEVRAVMEITASTKNQVHAVIGTDSIASASYWFRANTRCLALLKNFGEGPMRYEIKPVSGLSDCILYQFIEDIPEENAVCELDCRKHQCTEQEWITCRHRLSEATSELMRPDESNPPASVSLRSHSRLGHGIL
jgi:hypothetical protein